jgi:hypothetical protein
MSMSGGRGIIEGAMTPLGTVSERAAREAAIAARRQRVTAAYRAEQSIPSIAAKEQISTQTVWLDLKHLGIKTRSRSEAGTLGARGRSKAARERERDEAALREAARRGRNERAIRAVVLYEEGASTLTIAAELRVAPDTVSSYLEECGVTLRSLSEAARLRTDNEIRGARLLQFNQLRWAQRRDEIRAMAGDCGNAACDKTACSVSYGDCHQVGCEELAIIADESSRNMGWVKGEPKLYCPHHGPMRGADVRAAEIDDAHQRGWVTHGEAAGMLGIDRLAFHVRKGRITPVARACGFTFYAKDDVERLKHLRASRARAGKRKRAKLSSDGDGRSALPFDPDVEEKRRARWIAREVEKRGRSRDEANARARFEAEKRTKLTLRPGGPRKDELRDQLRAILRQISAEYDLSAFGRNEILAMVGEHAWNDHVGDFRERYPADTHGYFALRLRKNVIERVGRLVGDEVKRLKVLQIAATKPAT